jgi:hypothetical protein
MQTQVNIEFDQLVELAKQLPTMQRARLKKEVEESIYYKADSDLISCGSHLALHVFF